MEGEWKEVAVAVDIESTAVDEVERFGGGDFSSSVMGHVSSIFGWGIESLSDSRF